MAATILLYALVFFPMRGNYLGQLMTQRGPIQYEITLVTCWGLALLALRYLAVKRELRSTEMELQLIPLEIGMQITPGNVDQFVNHIGKLPPGQQRSILARRLRGALEHFKHRNNVAEVQTYLSSQAELDASAVDSGYTLLRVFIWVCPILGFIGTVTGISDAVTGLAQALPKTEATAPVEPGKAADGKPAENLSQKMLGGMQKVTEGLAVAFDTTFLGLICVVLLVFPYETLRKTEYAVLDRVEEFANESLLRRMAEIEGREGEPEMPQMVRDALEAAFREHQRWLTEWQAQVRQLGQVIGGDFETSVSRVAGQLGQAEAARLQELQRAAKAVEDLFARLTQTGQSPGLLDAMQKLSQAMIANNTLMSKLIEQQNKVLQPTAVHSSLQPVDPHATPTVASGSQQKRGIFGRFFGGNSQ